MTGGSPDTPPVDLLMEVALARGEPYMGGGNRPLRLSGRDAVWVVVQGSVDVFATRQGEDGIPTEFKHLLRAGPGRIIFPLSEESGDRALVAKGLPDSELRRIPLRHTGRNGFGRPDSRAGGRLGQRGFRVHSAGCYLPPAHGPGRHCRRGQGGCRRGYGDRSTWRPLDVQPGWRSGVPGN